MEEDTNSELSEVAEVEDDVELNIEIDKEFRNDERDNKSWVNRVNITEESMVWYVYRCK